MSKMVVKLGFDPKTLRWGEPLYWLFRLGGIGLKIWLLYGKNHLKSQHFASSCLFIHERLTGKVRMDTFRPRDPDNEDGDWDEFPWQEGDEIDFSEDLVPQGSDYDLYKFLEEMRSIDRGFPLAFCRNTKPNQQWVIDHWDYLNPNTQKKFYYQYELPSKVRVRVLVR